jgi:hypothetical protein
MLLERFGEGALKIIGATQGVTLVFKAFFYGIFITTIRKS